MTETAAPSVPGRALPDPWPALAAGGFHPDLVLRAGNFLKNAAAHGMADHARTALAIAGESFRRPFTAASVPIDASDARKRAALEAFEELADEFGDRVPSLIWTSLAFLAVRDDADEYASILGLQDELAGKTRLPWWIVDSALHASGKVFGFMLHVQSKLSRDAGLVLEHGCDCGGCIYPAEDARVRFRLPDERRELFTQALFSHFLSETILMKMGYPFNLGKNRWFDRLKI